MATMIDVKMPEDSQEGTTATVSRWLKKVGEAVKQHEPLVELDTDKVSMEVAAPADGVLREILLDEAEEAEPGCVLGRMEEGVTTASPAPEAAAPAPTQGDFSPASEGLAATSAEDGGDFAPAQRAADGGIDPERYQPDAEGLASVYADDSDTSRRPTSMPLSPSVRRLVSEHNLNVKVIRGTGKDGRITRNDVLAYLERRPKPRPRPQTPVPSATGTGTIPSQMVPHDKMRRRIANHMVSSLLETAPHVTAVFEMDMSAIIAHRKAHKANYAEKGVNLTFTAYFVAASVEALRQVPEVNSRWHDDALELFNDMNIGVGTALADKGLIVPVLHQAQSLNLFGIAQRLDAMTQKARKGQLAPSDVQNGTFTISNHGVSGSLIATPIIINQPQSAILGIGKLQKRVMVAETEAGDAIQIKPMAYVTLSIDHRALDAYHTNAFLSRFVEVIEGWR